MANPFNINIFVPEGDPDGLRVIERQTSPNTFLCFPRDMWAEVKKRKDLSNTGIYILAGYSNLDDESITIYVGQADNVRDRLEIHIKKKDFWSKAIVFMSDSRKLNSAHVKWLEHKLVKRLHEVDQCIINNENIPKEPTVSVSQKADLEIFLTEIYQTLPLVGITAFESPRTVAVNKTVKTDVTGIKDTIVVPAKKEGFNRVFINKRAWWAIRISGGMLDKIKYIAAYQVAPVSAITHFTEVSRIESIGEDGKYKVVFKGRAKKLDKKIEFGDAQSGFMQGPRYTSFKKLLEANTLSDI